MERDEKQQYMMPVMAYGNTVLRKTCRDVLQDDANTHSLIKYLWGTLGASGGVGLAAPQINSVDSVFIINSKLMYEELDDSGKKQYFQDDIGIKDVFINANIISRSDESWSDIEGCLSIPGINEDVKRSWSITIEYLDRSFKPCIKSYSGYTARVIQHEFDHTRAILFVDHLHPMRKRLLKNKLNYIKEGKVDVNYPITFLKKKR